MKFKLVKGVTVGLDKGRLMLEVSFGLPKSTEFLSGPTA